MYYSIRVIQDYLKEGIEIDLSKLLPELKEAISLPREELIELFKTSNYDILDQLKEEYKVIPEGILAKYNKYTKLGHYEITDKNIDLIDTVSLKVDNRYNRLIPKYNETYD